MILKDEGYCCTGESIEFFRKNRIRLGEIIKARMLDYETVAWPLRLIDNDGNEIWLSGCTAGYWGEGPRGTHTVLAESEIAIRQKYIIEHRSFVRTKNKSKGACISLKLKETASPEIVKNFYDIPGVIRIEQVFPDEQDNMLTHLFIVYTEKRLAHAVLRKLKRHPSIAYAYFPAPRKLVRKT